MLRKAEPLGQSQRQPPVLRARPHSQWARLPDGSIMCHGFVGQPKMHEWSTAARRGATLPSGPAWISEGGGRPGGGSRPQAQAPRAPSVLYGSGQAPGLGPRLPVISGATAACCLAFAEQSSPKQTLRCSELSPDGRCTAATLPPIRCPDHPGRRWGRVLCQNRRGHFRWRWHSVC